MVARIPAHVREQQINDLPNISFVRWHDGYRNNTSKAVCLCSVDGHEWAACVSSLVKGFGCPKCAGNQIISAEERVKQINELPNTVFVRWENGYKYAYSKAVCRCNIDGYEWTASVNSLINSRKGCPQCAGQRRWTAEERVEQINSISNITFVRWSDTYKNKRSKAICRCAVDGHEWAVAVDGILNGGRRCPQCAEYGFNAAKQGTLYALRSDCGSMVKIGISNNYERRHKELRQRTPFNWACIELLHGDGGRIAELEKELHRRTEQALFGKSFDGSTEWRKWDNRIPMWIERYRARL